MYMRETRLARRLLTRLTDTQATVNYIRDRSRKD